MNLYKNTSIKFQSQNSQKRNLTSNYVREKNLNIHSQQKLIQENQKLLNKFNMLRYKIARKYLYSTLVLSLLLVYFWLGKTNQNKSKSLKPYIFVSGYQRSGTTLMV